MKRNQELTFTGVYLLSPTCAFASAATDNILNQNQEMQRELQALEEGHARGHSGLALGLLDLYYKCEKCGSVRENLKNLNT